MTDLNLLSLADFNLLSLADFNLLSLTLFKVVSPYNYLIDLYQIFFTFYDKNLIFLSCIFSLNIQDPAP